MILKRAQFQLIWVDICHIRRERDVGYRINIGSFILLLRSVLVRTLRLPKEFLRFIEASVRVIPMSAKSRSLSRSRS